MYPNVFCQTFCCLFMIRNAIRLLRIWWVCLDEECFDGKAQKFMHEPEKKTTFFLWWCSVCMYICVCLRICMCVCVCHSGCLEGLSAVSHRGLTHWAVTRCRWCLHTVQNINKLDHTCRYTHAHRHTQTLALLHISWTMSQILPFSKKKKKIGKKGSSWTFLVSINTHCPAQRLR